MLSKDDEKLPYLHKITKMEFLVNKKNMGICLFMLIYYVKGFLNRLVHVVMIQISFI